MIIRQAEPKDKIYIQSLNQEIFDYEVDNGDDLIDVTFPSSDQGQQFFNDIVNGQNGHFGYVFEDENIIKGYVSLRVQNPLEYVHRKGLAILQLQTLGVDKNYRGQGIAKHLINHAKTVAKELGFSHLRAVALAGNTHARHVYKTCGFHEQEIVHEVEL